ncbi:hypothetical protein [Blastopirellula sediminis]|nr:hypothetical protein [Blastopirellula sediminis]
MVIAGLAVLLGIGKEIGWLPVIFVICLSGFVVPAFVANVWLRVGLAFGMTGLLLGIVNGILVLEQSSPGDPILYLTLIAPLRLLSEVSAAAIVVSSLLRWGCRQYLEYRSVLELSESDPPEE